MVKNTISEKIKPYAKKKVIVNKENKSYNLSMFGKSQRRSTSRAIKSDLEEFLANENGNVKLQSGGNKVSLK
jgi:hypothetical protein